MADRCLGQCCTFIPLSISDEELVFAAEQHGEECEVVREMFIPVGEFDIHPITLSRLPQATTLYRCKNLTPEGSCAIYPWRPAICRNFPQYSDEERRCYRPDCQWSKVSVKRLEVIDHG